MSKALMPTTAEDKAAMIEPFPADKCPMGLELNAGKTYYFCVCGLSKDQPFCDGSHSGTKFAPMPFVAKDQKLSYLCMCKRTGSMPYCDGTHKDIAF